MTTKITKISSLDVHETIKKESLFANLVNQDPDQIVYNFKPNQSFISKVLNSLSDVTEMLIYHVMGSGKTDIGAIVYWNNRYRLRKCLYLCKGNTSKFAVITNVRNWIKRHLKELNESEIDIIIRKHFEFQNHQAFANNMIKDLTQIKKYDNYCVVIDEVHHLTDSATLDKKDTNKCLKNMRYFIENIKNGILLLLTGTPMYDQQAEIDSIYSLILAHQKKPYSSENIASIKENNISYYGHISSCNVSEKRISPFFPDFIKNITEYPFVLLCMKEEQRRQAKYVMSTNEKKDDTQLMIAQASYVDWKWMNETKPNTELNFRISKTSDLQYEILDNKKLSKYYAKYIDSLILENRIGEHSIKIDYLFENIQQSEGLIYIYSDKVTGYGVHWIAAMLVHKFKDMYELCEYKDFETSTKPITRVNSTTKKKILVITPNTEKQSTNQMMELLEYFNSDINKTNQHIKIIIGSAVTGEALSIKNILDIFIFTPWWNRMKLNQIEARSIRIDSHENYLLPVKVKIHTLVCTTLNPEDINKNIEFGSLFNKQSFIDCRKVTYTDQKDLDIQKEIKNISNKAIDRHFYNNIINVSDDLKYGLEFYYSSQNYLDVISNHVINGIILVKDLCKKTGISENIINTLLGILCHPLFFKICNDGKTYKFTLVNDVIIVNFHKTWNGLCPLPAASSFSKKKVASFTPNNNILTQIIECRNSYSLFIYLTENFSYNIIAHIEYIKRASIVNSIPANVTMFNIFLKFTEQYFINVNDIWYHAFSPSIVNGCYSLNKDITINRYNNKLKALRNFEWEKVLIDDTELQTKIVQKIKKRRVNYADVYSYFEIFISGLRILIKKYTEKNNFRGLHINTNQNIINDALFIIVNNIGFAAQKIPLEDCHSITKFIKITTVDQFVLQNIDFIRKDIILNSDKKMKFIEKIPFQFKHLLMWIVNNESNIRTCQFIISELIIRSESYIIIL